MEVKVAKVGVVFGRFQVAELHPAHRALLSHVIENFDKVLVLIGDAPFKSKRNPLSYEFRAHMIRKFFETHTIHKFFEKALTTECLKDMPTQIQWENAADAIIFRYVRAGDTVTIISGRDDLIYNGKYIPVLSLGENPRLYSGTLSRQTIWDNPPNSQDFRAGIIYAYQDAFPRPTPTVDIVVSQGELILLGKKKDEPWWRLPGGCVDLSDISAEFAARRELFEETQLTVEGPLYYIGSRHVKDWRADSPDLGVMTSLFTTEWCFGKPEAKDDLVELRWFLQHYSPIVEVMEGHQVLIEMFMNWRKSVGK